MPLETATYISQLVTTNPANSDGLYQADDHMRLIKSAMLNTFPNFTAAALSSTQAQLDAVAALLVSGVLRGNGTVPAGAISDFGMTSAPTGWLVCDGSSVLRTTYPDLFTAIGTTWGSADGTHFNVPNLVNRFRRHAGSLAGAVGALQSPVNLTHNHSSSGTTDGGDVPDHLHALGGSTGSMDRAASHSHSIGGTNLALYGGGNPGLSGSSSFGSNPRSPATDSTNIDHLHALPATTGARDRSLVHSHTFTASVGASGDANESRPYSATVLTCIKT